MFDLLSAEYGWTDEYMLGLTPGRLRISVREIERRRLNDLRARHKLAEAHAKSVAQMFIGLAGKKAGKKMARVVNRINFWQEPDEEELTDSKYRGRPLPDYGALMGLNRRPRG